jgi:hypothetical protein
MQDFFARHIVVTGVIIVIAGLFVVNAATGDDGPSHDGESTLSSIERTLIDSYEYALRQRIRARGGRGDSVAIVSLECAWTRPRRALCLADVAATGRARRLVAPTVTLRVAQTASDHFFYEVVDG